MRDTEAEPLCPETKQLNPLIRRGRWLLTGLDLDVGDERSFWYESMVDVEQIELAKVDPKPLRVVIIDKAHNVIGSREFTDDKRAVYTRFFNANAEDCLAVAVG